MFGGVPAADGAAVIEWGEAVAADLPEDHLVVRFAIGDDGTRTLTLEPHGSWEARPLAEVVP